MHLDLIDLRLFLHVHETGTITGGAARSHMTLASASERIRGMEDAVGVALLRREPRGVSLTPAGDALLHHARAVLQQMERMRSELSEHRADLRGQVRVLGNTSALSEHLPGALGAFLSQQPNVRVELEEQPSERIADALRAGRCDIGIASDAADLHGLQTQRLRSDPLVLVVPGGHALASRSSIEMADVAERDFIGLNEASALQLHVEHHARQLGLRMNYRVRLRSFDAVCSMVGQGIGVAVVPRTAAVRCARGGSVKRVALTDAWASRNLMLCTREPQALPVSARRLMAHLSGA
ncbi:MAG: LysR-family transcriptional regulator [Rhizobacter sp.]|nr:LysR-family transcriptional regulator [Rhizobacter sp.]